MLTFLTEGHDPLTDCAKRYVAQGGFGDVIFLTGSELLHLSAKVRDHITEQLIHDGVLVNRLVDLDSGLFHDLGSVCRPITLWRNSRGLFSRFVERFPRRLGNPGRYNLSGDCPSLPAQWLTVQSHDHQLKVPRFTWRLTPSSDALPFEHSVIGEAFSLYRWKTNMVKNNDQTGLIYERPAGSPLLYGFCGDSELISTDRGDSCQPLAGFRLSQIEWVTQKGRELRRIFDIFAGEMLFFVASDHVTFAMVSPVHLCTGLSSRFDAMVQQGLTDAITSLLQSYQTERRRA